MELDEIIKRAIERASIEFNQPAMITDTLFPGQFPGADLDGWALFVAVPDSGGNEPIFIGVNMETGEAKVVDPDDEADIPE